MKNHKIPVILLLIASVSIFPNISAATEPEKGTNATAAAVPAKKVANESKEKKISVPACEVSNAIRITTPIFANEKNLQDKTFDAEARLRTSIPDFSVLKFSPAESSKDGIFTPAAATAPAKDSPAELRVYRFFVTTQAFTKAKIKVKTPQMCELYIDGVKVADKLTAQDSQEKATEVSADASMEMRRYEIVVKTLSNPEDKAAPSIGFEITTEKSLDKAQFSFPSAGEKRPLTLTDVSEGERVSGASLSPDGKYAIVTYSELMQNGSSRSRSEVRSVPDNKTVFISAGTNYAWMPNGSRIYFRQVKNGKSEFVIYDVETHERTLVDDKLPSENCSLMWMPDESGILIVKTEKWKNETDNYRRYADISDRIDGYRNRSFLYLYDIKSGILQRLTAGAKTTSLCDVSQDSSQVLFSTGEVDYTQPEYNKSSLYLLNLRTMKLRELIKDEPYGFNAKFSPDGDRLILTAGAQAFGEIGINLPAGATPNSFDMQAFIMNVEDGKIEAISKEFDPSISSFAWAGDGNIYLTAETKDKKFAYKYSPSDKKFTQLNIPEENVYGFSVSEIKKEFKPIATAVGQSATAMASAYVVNLNANSSSKMATSMPELPTKVAIPEVKDWNFTTDDGTEITGCFFLPPNFDASKKYPMIVYYYGGTSPVTRAFGSSYSFPLWASKGYVVYVLQPSGATGFGQEFSARHVNAWGKRTADDIISGTKKFCEAHSFVDPEKIGCIGASYGGFMTMYLQTRTDIFAAAVAHAGISDITSYWGEGYWGAAYNAVAAAGSRPWANKEIFVEQSPLFSADKIKTPILLCHGTADTNVPTGESINMFAALKLLGKPVELLTFKSENHFVLDYTRRKQWTRSQLAWFDRWLKKDSDWWYALYPDSKKTF